MAITVHNLRALSVYQEADTEFAEIQTNTSLFLPVPARSEDGITWTPDREFLNPGIVQQRHHGRSVSVHGPKSASLEFTVPLGTAGKQGSVSEASATAHQNALFRILGTVMGGVEGGGNGSRVESAASASVVTVTSATDIKAGGCVAWERSDGKIEMRPVASVTTNTITTKIAFSDTPSTNDHIYVATTFYLDGDVDESLQFLAEALNEEDRWSLRGFQLEGITLNLPFADLPTVGFSLQGADWEKLSTSQASLETYDDYTPVAYNGGVFLAQKVGTRTLKTVDTPEVNFESNLGFIPARSASGVNTIARYHQQHDPPVITGNFRPYYEGGEWFTAWDDRDLWNLALQINETEKRGIMIEVSGAQIGPVLATEESDGLSVHTVNFSGAHDEDATDKTTAMRRSPFRIHIVG